RGCVNQRQKLLRRSVNPFQDRDEFHASCLYGLFQQPLATLGNSGQWRAKLIAQAVERVSPCPFPQPVGVADGPAEERGQLVPQMTQRRVSGPPVTLQFYSFLTLVHKFPSFFPKQGLFLCEQAGQINRFGVVITAPRL